MTEPEFDGDEHDARTCTYALGVVLSIIVALALGIATMMRGCQ